MHLLLRNSFIQRGAYRINFLPRLQLRRHPLGASTLLRRPVKVHGHVDVVLVGDLEELGQEGEHVTPLTSAGPVRIESAVQAIWTTFCIHLSSYKRQ